MDGSAPAAAPCQDVEDLYALHKAACDAHKESYRDPKTGYHVFTEYGLRKRGRCCGSGCRHCPYAHERVPKSRLLQRMNQPAFLHTTEGVKSAEHVRVLFFSGGKDSFLALRSLIRGDGNSAAPESSSTSTTGDRRTNSQAADILNSIILLNTFDAGSRRVAHQEVASSDILRQAKHLDLPLIGVPLIGGLSEASPTYVDRVSLALAAIKSSLPRVERITLAFGDLHLEHIRAWRERRLSAETLSVPDGVELLPNRYPVWRVAYADLYADLERSTVPCVVSAVSLPEGVSQERKEECEQWLKLGEMANSELFHKMAEAGLDAMGECGEYHTLAKVWEVPRTVALGIAP